MQQKNEAQKSRFFLNFKYQKTTRPGGFLYACFDLRNLKGASF